MEEDVSRKPSYLHNCMQRLTCGFSRDIIEKCDKKMLNVTILSLDHSGLHLVQVLFDTQLLVFDHFLLLVHGFLDFLTHNLESEKKQHLKHYQNYFKSPKDCRTEKAIPFSSRLPAGL